MPPEFGGCVLRVVELDWRGSAQSDLGSIEDEAIQDEIAVALLDIVEDPFLGDELRYIPGVGDLSDCRKLYVDVPPDRRPPGPKRYRIVYRMLPDETRPQKVEVISIGVRADLVAYRRAVVRLNRPPGRRTL
jgi:mRNA interferase RelE/StbE